MLFDFTELPPNKDTVILCYYSRSLKKLLNAAPAAHNDTIVNLPR